jgi:hypothetical protein
MYPARLHGPDNDCLRTILITAVSVASMHATMARTREQNAYMYMYLGSRRQLRVGVGVT